MASTSPEKSSVWKYLFTHLESIPGAPIKNFAELCRRLVLELGPSWESVPIGDVFGKRGVLIGRLTASSSSSSLFKGTAIRFEDPSGAIDCQILNPSPVLYHFNLQTWFTRVVLITGFSYIAPSSLDLRPHLECTRVVPIDDAPHTSSFEKGY